MSDSLRELTTAQRVAFSMPQLGMSVSGTIMGSWLMFFLVPPESEIAGGKLILVSAAAYGWLELWGRLIDAVADPVVGHWSDRTRTRWGRRLPFIVLGTPALTVSFVLMWFLPFEPGGLGNVLYLGVILTVYWVLFTVVLGPYSALLPEIATSGRGRIVLSSTMGMAGAIGMIIGGASGEFISQFPDGMTLLGVYIPSGIQVVGVFGGACILLCLMPALNIRETPHSKAKEIDTGVIEGIRDAARNASFFPVVGIAFCFRFSGTMIAAMLPYLTTVALERLPGQEGLVAEGMGEAWQSRLLAIVLGGALLWLPFIHKIGERVSHKALMMFAAGLYAAGLLLMPASLWLDDPAWGIVVIMVLLSFPTCIALVMPLVLFAEVIDYDETISGLRREGIYNGSVALLTKWADGLARVAVVSLLVLGSSKTDATGVWAIAPAAGVVMLLGMISFAFYPERAMKEAIEAHNKRSELAQGEHAAEGEVGPA